MSTAEITVPDVDLTALADLEALLRHYLEHTPIDPELSRRVEERTDQVMEEIRQRHVNVDVDALLHDARNEA